jgi:hypothetical protein
VKGNLCAAAAAGCCCCCCCGDYARRWPAAAGLLLLLLRPSRPSRLELYPAEFRQASPGGTGPGRTRGGCPDNPAAEGRNTDLPRSPEAAAAAAAASSRVRSGTPGLVRTVGLPSAREGPGPFRSGHSVAVTGMPLASTQPPPDFRLGVRKSEAGLSVWAGRRGEPEERRGSPD